MKHIFFVHSPITFIVACKVIQLKEIPSDNIIFLTHRGFHVPISGFKTYVFPYQWSPEPFPFQVNFFNSWKRLEAFDQFINEITEKSLFSIYLPHTEFRVLKILISHPFCQDFSYIEEGLAAYFPLNVLNPKQGKRRIHLIDRIFYKNRIKDKLFMNSGYKAAYGLYPESFPAFEDRVILDKIHTPGVAMLASLFEKDYSLYENAHIIVLDAISEHGVVGRQEHMVAIKRLIQILREKNVKKLFIKYHPAQVGTQEYYSIQKILSHWPEAEEVVEIPQDVYLEIVAKKCRSVCFYINVSSIGFYAYKEGQRVVSWANLILQVNKKYSETILLVKQPLLDKIEMLPI